MDTQGMSIMTFLCLKDSNSLNKKVNNSTPEGIYVNCPKDRIYTQHEEKLSDFVHTTWVMQILRWNERRLLPQYVKSLFKSDSANIQLFQECCKCFFGKPYNYQLEC